MTEAAIFVVSIVLAGLAGAVLHELTHLAVARAGGRDAWIEWRALNQRHYLPMTGPDTIDYLVGVAPFAVGGLIASVWVGLQLPTSIPMLVGWGVYSLGGIPNDFRF